jgi:hypothetical protein
MRLRILKALSIHLPAFPTGNGKFIPAKFPQIYYIHFFMNDIYSRIQCQSSSIPFQKKPVDRQEYPVCLFFNKWKYTNYTFVFGCNDNSSN